MKCLYYIFFTLLLANCRNIEEKTVAKKEVILDTVAKIVDNHDQTDSLTKISKVFPLNGLTCYWEHLFIIYKSDGEVYQLEITMILRNFKTKQVLLEVNDNPKNLKDYDYTSEAYFDTINKDHFVDLNFDGFKDFKIYSNGSTAMTSMTNIYTFNSKTKLFEDSELSDNTIEELDAVNKILITSSWDPNARYLKKHHFGNYGQIRFSEYITEEDYSPNDTASKLIRTYQKMIKKKELEIKVDTVDH